MVPDLEGLVDKVQTLTLDGRDETTSDMTAESCRLVGWESDEYPSLFWEWNQVLEDRLVIC